MEVQLFKIKRERFDEILDKTIKEYNAKGEILVDENLLLSASEPIIVNSSVVSVSIDLDYYKSVACDQSILGYTKLAKIGMKLHQDFNLENSIPTKTMYEKELWAYLSLTVFFDVVKKLRLDQDDKINEDKIKRFYFNVGTISRTGLLFIWSMIDRLGAENNYEMAHTAFEFIDPVKAIFERTFSKNPLVLRAFVQGIINNGKDARFKNNMYRTRVPNHISCFAGVNMLDVYSYEELVQVVTEQQEKIISQRYKK